MVMRKIDEGDIVNWVSHTSMGDPRIQRKIAGLLREAHSYGKNRTIAHFRKMIASSQKTIAGLEAAIQFLEDPRQSERSWTREARRNGK
jgi:hypothetical protein